VIEDDMVNYIYIDSVFQYSMFSLMILAGFPATIAPSGTSFSTTDPLATMAHFPMVTPHMMTAPAPMDAP
jgi:hypothetical protein